jgi:hypothetical protein
VSERGSIFGHTLLWVPLVSLFLEGWQEKVANRMQAKIWEFYVASGKRQLDSCLDVMFSALRGSCCFQNIIIIVSCNYTVVTCGKDRDGWRKYPRG